MAIKKLIGHIFIVIVMFLSKLLLHRHQCCRYHYRCCCRNRSSGALLIVKFSIHHILIKKRSKIVMVQMRDNFALEVPDRSSRILPHIAPLEMIFKIAFEITSDWYLVWRSQFAKSSSSPYRHHHRHRHCYLYRYHFCFYLSTIILRYIPRPRQR